MWKYNSREKKSWYPKRDAINKSTNNDRLTKEFYFTFYEKVKSPLILSLRYVFLKSEVIILQKQAVIKLTEKKSEARDILKTGKPLIRISANQTAYLMWKLLV